jgi:hypothetical protein
MPLEIITYLINYISMIHSLTHCGLVLSAKFFPVANTLK